MTPEMLTSELNRIPPPSLAKLKQDLGMPDKDLTAVVIRVLFGLRAARREGLSARRTNRDLGRVMGSNQTVERVMWSSWMVERVIGTSWTVESRTVEGSSRRTEGTGLEDEGVAHVETHNVQYSTKYICFPLEHRAPNELET